MKVKTKLILIAIACAGYLCVSAQQVPYDPLGPEPGQDKIELRKIPPPPVNEGAEARTQTERPTAKTAATNVVYDETTAKEAAIRPIPPKPRDENDIGAIPQKAVRPQTVDKIPAIVGDSTEKEAPIRKIPAKPVNEGN